MPCDLGAAADHATLTAVPFSIHVPEHSGRAALEELDQVPWRKLEHAYYRIDMGPHPISTGLHDDVAASLRALGAADPGPAITALFSNIYHQRTVYEATAYAVPFVAAVAADPDLPGDTARLRLLDLVLAIALSSSWETADGTQAGAFGDGTMELVRAGLRASLPSFEAAAALEPAAADCVAPLRALLAGDPSEGRFEAVRVVLVAIEAEVGRRNVLRDEARPAAPVETARFHHAKFGDATLVRRLESDRLQLKFDDGTERTILARFLTPL